MAASFQGERGVLGRKGPSSASTTGYSARKIAEVESKQTLGVAGIQAVRDIMVEVLSATKANPILGVLIGVILLDVLHRAGIITASAYSLGNTMLSVAFGVTVAIEVADTGVAIISSITGGGATPPDPAELIKPVPTTYVEASNAPSPTSSGAAGGLVGKLLGRGGAAPEVPAGALMG